VHKEIHPGGSQQGTRLRVRQDGGDGVPTCLIQPAPVSRQILDDALEPGADRNAILLKPSFGKLPLELQTKYVSPILLRSIRWGIYFGSCMLNDVGLSCPRINIACKLIAF
jgi:hypothetical protein